MALKNAPQFICILGNYLFCKKISRREKFFAVAFTLAYIISPVDLIPDIPVIGWLDDIGIGALFLAYCSWRVKAVNTQAKSTEKGEKWVEAKVTDPILSKKISEK